MRAEPPITGETPILLKQAKALRMIEGIARDLRKQRIIQWPGNPLTIPVGHDEITGIMLLQYSITRCPESRTAGWWCTRIALLPMETKALPLLS